MSLYRGKCLKCKGTLWRPNDECRGCWLQFFDDDRNTSVGVRFWGRKAAGEKFSFFFDWVGLTAAGIARASARVTSGGRAEANSTENSPATNDWLPVRAMDLTLPRTADLQRYDLWLQLRAFSLSDLDVLRKNADIKIRLR